MPDARDLACLPMIQWSLVLSQYERDIWMDTRLSCALAYPSTTKKLTATASVQVLHTENLVGPHRAPPSSLANNCCEHRTMLRVNTICSNNSMTTIKHCHASCCKSGNCSHYGGHQHVVAITLAEFCLFP